MRVVREPRGRLGPKLIEQQKNGSILNPLPMHLRTVTSRGAMARHAAVVATARRERRARVEVDRVKRRCGRVGGLDCSRRVGGEIVKGDCVMAGFVFVEVEKGTELCYLGAMSWGNGGNCDVIITLK